MPKRNCKYDADQFCYVCGEFGKKKSTRYCLTDFPKTCEAFQHFFGYAPRNLDKSWVPSSICATCKKTLDAWVSNKKRALPFTSPRTWLKPSNHYSDCYFCMVNVRPGPRGAPTPPLDIPSSRAPKRRNQEESVPSPPKPQVPVQEVRDVVSDVESGAESDSDFTYQDDAERYFPKQADLNDLFKEANVTIEAAELITSRLKQWRLVNDDVRVTAQRNRHRNFAKFFETKNGICFCSDVNSLFKAMNITHVSSEWRLFVDASSKSLKAVLLHNGNVLPTIPVAYTTKHKESYESMRLLFELLKYEEHKWEVIGDFKVVGLVLGIQQGFVKYPCSDCLWDSRADDQHYKKKTWPKRKLFSTGKNNIVWVPIIDPGRILMPPLHIKLGLKKQFVRGLGLNSMGLKYLIQFFKGEVSEAKVIAGVFTGPQIRKVMADEKFPKLLTAKQRKAWNSFKAVAEGFLGNHRATNYQQLVRDMVNNFQAMGCRMSLKLHMLDSHLDLFKDNMGAYSEEQGERFHQDLLKFEERFVGKCDENMMGDYIWSLTRESKRDVKRKARGRPHLPVARS